MDSPNSPACARSGRASPGPEDPGVRVAHPGLYWKRAFSALGRSPRPSFRIFALAKKSTFLGSPRGFLTAFLARQRRAANMAQGERSEPCVPEYAHARPEGPQEREARSLGSRAERALKQTCKGRPKSTLLSAVQAFPPANWAAHSGLDSNFDAKPSNCPWASLVCPFEAKSGTPNSWTGLKSDLFLFEGQQLQKASSGETPRGGSMR